MPEKGLNEISRGVRDLYEKGLAAIHKSNFDYAITLLGGILSRDPSFFPAREALRAAQLKKAGGRGSFLKRMLGSASQQPLLAKAQLGLRSNPLEAIRTAEQILNTDPYSVAAHKVLADAALAADLPKTAVLSLELAFKSSPDRQIALRLGQALVRSGEVARADEILSELARTFPKDPEIAQAMKNVAAKRTMSEGGYGALEDGSGSYRDILRHKHEVGIGDHAEEGRGRQISDLERQLASDAKNVRLWRELGQLLTQKRLYDEALSAYERVIELEGHAEPALEQTVTEVLLKRLDDRISALDPTSAEFSAAKEALVAERNHCELDRTQSLSNRYPNDLTLQFQLGEVCFRQGKITEAIQAFQRAQNNPHKRVRALYFLAQCFMRRGILDLAARTLQNALREKPTFDEERKELIYALGEVYEKQGKAAEAMDQYKLIYEVDIGYRDVAARVDAFHASQ